MSEKTPKGPKELIIPKRNYEGLLREIQRILALVSGDVRDSAKVALMGTVVIKPTDFMDQLRLTPSAYEVRHDQTCSQDPAEQQKTFLLPPLTVPEDWPKVMSGDAPDMPSGCPPPQLIDGKFMIEGKGDCVTYPFYGIALELVGDTSIAYRLDTANPDLELYGGTIWIQDFRSDLAHLANIKVFGNGHNADVSPTKHSGLDFRDKNNLRVFAKLGDASVTVDYIPEPVILKENDDVIFILSDGTAAGAGTGSTGGASATGAGGLTDAGAVPDSSVASENAPGAEPEPEAAPSCNMDNSANKSTGFPLKGTLTLGFLFVAGLLRKKNK